MKFEKKIKKKRLSNLNKLKPKISRYKKSRVNYFLKKDIEFKLKNVFYIIFKFHFENKKILFLGTPLRLNKQLKELLKNTNHSYIPEKIWLGGVLTNTKAIFKFLFKKRLKKKKNSLKILFNLTERKNLVVILNEYLSVNPLKEFSNKRVPTISLNYSSINLSRPYSIYRIKKQNINSNENRSIENLFFFFLRVTLKKAEKARKKAEKEKKRILKLILEEKQRKAAFRRIAEKRKRWKQKQRSLRSRGGKGRHRGKRR